MIILFSIIAITVAVSVSAFNNRELMAKMQFNPYLIQNRRQAHRFVSYGLVHADWGHLGINMFVFYSFGRIVLEYYQYYFGSKGIMYFLMLYIAGLAFSTIADFARQKNNFYYNAVGASGAVSAIVFASILFEPMSKIYLFFIPIGIPAFIFGVLYLAYSAYMAKRNQDNIGHDAHFWGAVFGFVFTIILKPSLIPAFFESILNGF